MTDKRKPIKVSGLVKAGVIASPSRIPTGSPDAGSIAVTQSNPLILPKEESHPLHSSPVSTVDIAGRTYGQIPFGLIDENPIPPREIYTEAMIAEIAEDLKQNGQRDPIHIIPHPDIPGRFIIADGQTRVFACKNHGVLETLLAEIHYGLSLHDASIFGYRQNALRNEPLDIDKGYFFARLIANGVTQSAVSKQLTVSEGFVSSCLIFSKLPPELLDLVRQSPGKLSANAIQPIFRILQEKGIAKAITVAASFVQHDHPISWLRNQVEALGASRKRKSADLDRRSIVPYTTGELRQRGNNFEVKFCVVDDKRDEFAKDLETLLNKYGEPVHKGKSSSESNGDANAH